MKERLCMVSQCRYRAEGAIEDDFLVCALHDHPATRAILEEFRLPGHYWTRGGFPVVLPCGPLLDEHFTPREAEGLISALDAPELAEVPAGPADCHPSFDLMREP